MDFSEIGYLLFKRSMKDEIGYLLFRRSMKDHMRQHISKIVGVCFYHLRRRKKVRRILEYSVKCRLVTALITSRLDYCNAFWRAFRS